MQFGLSAVRPRVFSADFPFGHLSIGSNVRSTYCSFGQMSIGELFFGHLYIRLSVTGPFFMAEREWKPKFRLRIANYNLLILAKITFNHSGRRLISRCKSEYTQPHFITIFGLIRVVSKSCPKQFLNSLLYGNFARTIEKQKNGSIALLGTIGVRFLVRV